MAILFADGTTQSSAAGGKILQVKQTVVSSQIEGTYTGGAQVCASVDITPASSSNKILVCVNSAGCGSRTADTNWYLYMYRDSTFLMGVDTYVGDSYSGGNTSNPNAMYLDSPSTTSSITYKIEGTRQGGSGNCVYNHSNGNAKSSITVMEVAA